MPRDSRVHLEDVLGAIGKIKRYTKGLSKQSFAGDESLALSREQGRIRQGPRASRGRRG